MSLLGDNKMIKGIEGLSTTEINDELTRGVRFIVYQ